MPSTETKPNSTSTPRFRRTVAGALVVLLLGLGGTVYVVMNNSYTQTYNALSDTHRTSTFPRPDDPPQWPLSGGNSAVLYINAVDLFVAKADPNKLAALEKVGTSLNTREPTVGEGNEIRVFAVPKQWRDHDKFPDDCKALGVEPRLGSHLSHAFQDILCAELPRHTEALDRLEQGSRQKEAKSPIHVWSERASPQHDLTTAFGALGVLALFRGLVFLYRGDGDRWVETVSAVLRFAQDLERGADLSVQQRVVKLHHIVMGHIESVLQEGLLTAAQAGRLIDELVYISKTPFDFRTTAEASFLRFVPVHRVSELKTPTHVQHLPAPSTFTRRIKHRLEDRIQLDWIQHVARMKLNFAQREQIRAAHQPHILTTVIGGAINMSNIDEERVAIDAQIVLLQWVAADYKVRATQNRIPTKRETLVNAASNLVQNDPLYGQPVVFHHKENKRWIMVQNPNSSTTINQLKRALPSRMPYVSIPLEPD